MQKYVIDFWHQSFFIYNVGFNLKQIGFCWEDLDSTTTRLGKVAV